MRKMNPLVIGAIVGALAFFLLRQQRQRRAALQVQQSATPTGSESVPYNPSNLYRRMGH